MPINRPGDVGELTVAIPGSTGNYTRIPLVTAVDFPESTAETTEETTLDGETTTSVSLPGAGDCSATIQLAEGFEYWEILKRAHRTGGVLSFRFQQQKGGAQLAQPQPGDTERSKTLAIASNGTMTGAGGLAFGSPGEEQEPFVPGNAVVIGNVCYIIEAVLSGTTARVSRYGAVTSNVATADTTALATVSATAPASYTIVKYAVRKSFSGTVTGLGGGSSSVGSVRTVPLTVTLSARPSDALLLATS